MCGIVGYVGDNFAEIVGVDGLKRLEYRGYYSAGVAFPLHGGLKLRRRVGKIINLEREVLKEPLQAHVGIGPTRWATHGAPTEANTHPHTDAGGRIAVVHNGIIENYLELRHELEAAGDHFTSATDTEVVPHLVAGGLARGLGLVEAFRAALRRLEGSFALALVSASHPGGILGARPSPPSAPSRPGGCPGAIWRGGTGSDPATRWIARAWPCARKAIATSWPRRSTSNRAFWERPSRAASPTAAATWCSTASASRATRCASSSTSRSSPAGRHGTPGSSAAISSRDWRASPSAWTTARNFEGAPRCCRSARSSSPSRSRERPPTPSRRSGASGGRACGR